MTVGKVNNMSHDEGNSGDQYKSYKEVFKKGNDRSYALPKGHGGNRGRGKEIVSELVKGLAHNLRKLAIFRALNIFPFDNGKWRRQR
jgi:hypothetical protein